MLVHWVMGEQCMQQEGLSGWEAEGKADKEVWERTNNTKVYQKKSRKATCAEHSCILGLE